MAELHPEQVVEYFSKSSYQVVEQPDGSVRFEKKASSNMFQDIMVQARLEKKLDDLNEYVKRNAVAPKATATPKPPNRREWKEDPGT